MEIRMRSWKRFPNPPISEALLDIRATLPSGTQLTAFDAFQETIREKYPTRRQRYSWQAGLRLPSPSPPEIVEQSSGPDGYMFTSADGRQVVQTRLDGFTFNRLKPYESWESFRDEAKLHWDRYKSIARPLEISRIALRFINRLELPASDLQFKDYVLTVPEIAPTLPQVVSSFLMRLVIPVSVRACFVILTETIEPHKGDTLPFILDIDAYIERSIQPDSEELWEDFERLREVKNEMFFGNITARAEELFK